MDVESAATEQKEIEKTERVKERLEEEEDDDRSKTTDGKKILRTAQFTSDGHLMLQVNPRAFLGSFRLNCVCYDVQVLVQI